MSTTDPLTAIREITEAAQAYCEGLNGHPGPYVADVGYCIVEDAHGNDIASFETEETTRLFAAVLTHAPAGWDARLRGLIAQLDHRHEAAWQAARAVVDRAIALQRGEG